MDGGFRNMVADMDECVFTTLHDPVRLDGREIMGMFVDMNLAPRFGDLKTMLREPQLEIRAIDAVGVEKGSIVEFNGMVYSVVSIAPNGSGITNLIVREKRDHD